jgi:hypothetical protein
MGGSCGPSGSSDAGGLGADSSGCSSDMSGLSDSQTSTDSLASSPTSTESLASSPTTSDTLSGNTCAVPGDSPTEAEVDDFHACTSGVNDRDAIDRAQAQTQNGGCAALSDDAMLCNPAGPEIGEFTVGRPEGFPDYIGPDADYDHTYRSEASTIGGWSSLADHVNSRIADVPTPGRNQTEATPAGVVNDAGITPLPNTDLVRSSISTDVQGRPVVSNVTIPGQHMLNPGIVSQTAWSDGRSTHAIAVGEGNGVMSIPANPIAREVFENKLEADIRAGIWSDTQR